MINLRSYIKHRSIVFPQVFKHDEVGLKTIGLPRVFNPPMSRCLEIFDETLFLVFDIIH